MTTGMMIKQCLKERCQTRKWLSQQLGVSDWVITQWVYDRVKPKVEMILLMSDLFSVQITDLDPDIYSRLPKCPEGLCDYASEGYCTILTHTTTKCSFRKMGGKAV